jgi:hypothetical protein
MYSQKRQVLLVVDNCPAHPALESLLAVRLVFLPPNTTSHTQPMDAGIIRCLKTHYRRQLLLKMLQSMDAQIVFIPTLFMAIHLLSQSWNLIDENIIRNCFRHCGFYCPSSVPFPNAAQNLHADLDNIFERVSRFLHLPTSVKPEQYLSVDDAIHICALTTDQDIIDSVKSDASKSLSLEVNDNEAEDGSLQLPTVKLCEAIRAVETVEMYLAQQDIDSTELKLNSLASLLSQQYYKGLRQSRITDYFSK